MQFLRGGVARAVLRTQLNARWCSNKGSNVVEEEREFSKEKNKHGISEEDVMKLAAANEQADRVWAMAAPERQWTWHSPATAVIFTIICIMQVALYMKHGDTMPDDTKEKARLKEETKGWE